MTNYSDIFCGLSLNDIDRFNVANARRPETMVTLLGQAPETMAGSMVAQKITAQPLPRDTRYDSQGQVVPEVFYRRLQGRMALEKLPEEQTVRYAVAVNNGYVRVFPTEEASYREPDDGLDRFSATVIKLGEPALVWHEDRSGQWYFVQHRNGWGWVRKRALALCDRRQWQAVLEEREFMLVTASRLPVLWRDGRGDTHQQLLLMGARLPLMGRCAGQYVVTMPRQDRYGRLQMLPTAIAAQDGLREGYVPFCPAAAVSLAMQTLGEPYGWGGTGLYRDCTSLVDDVFSTFGFCLARNSSQQLCMPGVRPIPPDMGEDQRLTLLDTLPPAAVLYFPGHAMLYLGRRGEAYRILHSVWQLGVPIWDELVTYPVKRVMLGHIQQHRVNGQTLLASLSGYWCFGR